MTDLTQRMLQEYDRSLKQPLGSVQLLQNVGMSANVKEVRHVLVVEDDVAIRELLRDHLSLEGFDISECADGREALTRTRDERFDLLVLDVMLPGLDGITLCRTIRAQGANQHTPVLMLTARDGESDKVLGLESGADDYVTKPFGIREFLARVSAILRRSQPPADEEPSGPGRVVATKGMVLDPERREARIRGDEVEMTTQEFDVLYLLASKPGIVFSRDALLSRVWPRDAFVTARTVDTVVSRIRKKIERDPQDPEFLLTAWGVGYKFADAD